MNQKYNIEKDFSVIILAAGKSERLGFPKLSLKYNNQRTFIEQIVHLYNDFGCKEIIVVVNKTGNKYINENELQFPDKVKFAINEYPEWHRFYSLKTGVRALNESHSVFIHNVDNPFVNHQVLSKLLENNTKDYIIPEYEGKGGHPILLSGKIVRDIKMIEENRLHLKEFLSRYEKIKISVPNETVLININTIDEYNKFFSA